MELTKCLHLPKHNAICPDVTLKAVVVAPEILRWVPAQRYSLLLKCIAKDFKILYSA